MVSNTVAQKVERCKTEAELLEAAEVLDRIVGSYEGRLDLGERYATVVDFTAKSLRLIASETRVAAR